MTLAEFTKLIGTDADNLTQVELEVYYNMSINFFNAYFSKWKKEKLPSVK